MKSHRKAREVALQVLFQKSFQSKKSAEELFNSFADNFIFDDQTKEYALYLTESVIEKEEELNSTISSLSDNWRIDRIAMIDKILLQIGIFEIAFSKETTTAHKLTIIDILDLAKKYSSEDSKNFINGILDQIYNQNRESL